MATGLVALMLSALFAGAAIYVSFVEQPARLLLDDRAALEEWQPSYKRGAMMQASLALAAFLAGAGAWWLTRLPLFAFAAVLQILPWPWTLLVIRPTNNALLAMDPAAAGAHSRALLEKWGRLHLVRTALGFAAMAVFFAGLTA